MEKVTHDVDINVQRSRGSLWETVRFALIALAIIVVVRTFIATPFIVDGPSMSPAFQTNDYLIIDKLSYRFQEPARDDIVIFRYPYDPSTHHIKRIIGLPGDTISVHDGLVTISNEAHPEGFTLDETYLDPANNQIAVNDYRTLGENEFYVMGDNRDNSFDSRRYGALDRSFITGHVLLRLFPFDTIALYPGSATETIQIHATSSSL